MIVPPWFNNSFSVFKIHWKQAFPIFKTEICLSLPPFFCQGKCLWVIESIDTQDIRKNGRNRM
jgi:hypothetical protein